MMKINTELILPVIDTGSDAKGICKTEGLVIFVDGTVQGDIIRLRVDTIQKNYATGTCLEILTPSPDRQIPDCPLYSCCGGCNMRHMTRARELACKENTVRQALRRVHLRNEVSPVLAGEPYEYRNKAVFHMDESGRTGYYASRSHKVFSGMTQCKIIPTVFGDIAAFTEKYFEMNPAFAALSPCALYVRKNEKGQIIAAVQTKDTYNRSMESIFAEYANELRHCFREIIGVLHSDAPEGKYATPTYTVVWGERYLIDTIAGLHIRLSPEGFHQVNHMGAVMLADTVLSVASRVCFTTAADLYCGSGFFGLLLAREFPDKTIYGIDINADSIRDAEINRQINQITNIHFFCGDAADFAKKVEGKPDFILIDPPRAGCSEKMRRQLLEISPETIVYVSCNPMTLARDLAYFQENGYEIRALQPVDMFPGTEHVETVVLMSKKA